jgi:hypothetical protein
MSGALVPQFANFANSSLAGNITNTATTCNLQSGTGTLFPALTAGQFFVGVFTDAATRTLREVVHVMAISGDTLTLVRAQEGTTGLAWSVNDLFALINTAGTMQALVSAIQANGPAIVGAARGLAGSAAGTSVFANWTAAELVAETASGITYKGSALTLSFNGGGTGAGGMDTGAMPVAADLSVYAIYNPSANTWNTLGCTGTTSNGATYTGAHMPAGYTASALLWAGVTLASQFRPFQQFGRTVWLRTVVILSGSTSATSYTSQTLSNCVPAAAYSWGGDMSITSTISNTLYISADANNTGVQTCGSTQITSAVANGFGPVPLITAQTFFYKIAGGTATVDCNVDSYNF